MAEVKNLDLICRKVERTDLLIAKFIDGYASGWEFAVKEVFKDSLDIKKTDKTINKKTFKIYTQGVVYKFEEGDLFHNDKSGYENWNDFINGENPITLQVQFGSSSGYQTKNTKTTITSPLEIKDNSKVKVIDNFKITEQVLNKGNLQVLVLKPNSEKTKMLEYKTINITVVDFVSLLQNGIFYDKEKEQYISYKFRDKQDG